MATFTVSAVVDGDTFDVKPGWKWQGQTGTRVRPTGYDAPELRNRDGAAAKAALEWRILGKTVELGTGHRVDRGRLVCEVYVNGKNLAEYFPAYG